MGDSPLQENAVLALDNVPLTLLLTNDNFTYKIIGNESTSNPSSELGIRLDDVIKAECEDLRTENEALNLLYVVEKEKHEYNVESVKFKFKDNGSAERWKSCIDTAIDNLELKRPKRLLVFVNPYSGKQNNVSKYETHAAPLFRMAGIKTDVIVTERANHAKEAIMEYDLSTVDGVVAVGGDGTFSECCTGLLLRRMKEANVSVDDPENDLIAATTPLAAIPSGTGNQISRSLYGTIDTHTAVLHIILGSRKERSFGVTSVYSGTTFLSYCFILLSLGQHADLFYDVDQHRNLGMVRFPVYLIKHIMTPTGMDVSVQYSSIQRKNQDQNESESKNGISEWMRLEGKYIGIDMLPYDMLEHTSPASIEEFDNEAWHVYFIKDGGRWDLVKYYKHFIGRKLDECPLSERLAVRGVKFHIRGGGKSRDDKYPISIDGDASLLKGKDVTIRFHDSVIKCLGRPWKKEVSVTENMSQK